jgi:hypothetical protein
MHFCNFPTNVSSLGLRKVKLVTQLITHDLQFSFSVVLGFELRASHLLGSHFYHLCHSTSPLCVCVVFSRWVLLNYLVGAGFELFALGWLISAS